MNKIIYCILIISLFIANQLFAQDIRKKRQAGEDSTATTEVVETKPCVLKGTIIDKATAEGIVSAKITIEGKEMGSLTDVDGNFTFTKLEPGEYSIKIEYLGYQSKKLTEITLKSGEVKQVSAVLEEVEIATKDVVIEEKVEESSNVAQMSMQKLSLQAVDIFSGDMILKETADFSMVNVLRRMPGVALIDDNTLVVRGMSERYNNFQLNKAFLPVNDLETVGFDFNSLPSNLITGIQLIKTATPDMTAEMAGGLISITTADMPSKNSFRVSLQGAYNSLVTGQNYLTYEAKDKHLGIFSEVRPLLPDNAPTAREILYSPLNSSVRYDAARSWDNSITPKLNKSQLPAINANLNFQRRTKLAGRDLGLVAVVNYTNSHQVENSLFYQVETVEALRDSIPNTTISTQRLYNSKRNANVILNAIYHISPKSKISWKNLLNYYSATLVDTAYGTYLNPLDTTNTQFLLYYYNPQRQKNQDMYSTQLLGEHSFNAKEGKLPITLKWEANLAIVNSREPGYFSSNYDLDVTPGSTDSNQFLYTVAHQAYIYALMGKQNDDILGGRVDLNIPLSHSSEGGILSNISLKTGLFTNLRSRQLRSRIAAPWYAHDANGLGYHNFPSTTVRLNNLPNFFIPENVRDSGLTFIEKTNNYNNYDANSNNYAFYAMADMNITKKLRGLVGFRLEHFTQKINLIYPIVTDSNAMGAYNYYNPAISYPLNDTNPNFAYPPYRAIGDLNLVNTTMGDLLPYLTMIYGVTEKTNLRFSVNQTLTRTKEQELIPLNLLNQITGVRNIGNPNLIRTKITHFDLRFETFPTGTEIMSASLFYKYFDNPAEASLVGANSAGDGYLSTFTNQNSAMVAGIEIEFRRRLGSIFASEGFLKNFTIYTNLSLMQSRVEVASVSPSEIFEKGRPLQGQANYVINAGLIFSEPKTKISFAMFYNRVGERISSVSRNLTLYPNIFELARNLIDFQVTKNFKNGLAIRISTPDILNNPLRWAQIVNKTGEDRNYFDPSRDKVTTVTKRGFICYLGLSYQF